MINFLSEWFKLDGNVGKSFKYAYKALVEEFSQQGDGVKASMHGCYKAFRRYTDYTYKRI